MADERITENFFRNLIIQDELYKKDKIIFEEQSSIFYKILVFIRKFRNKFSNK